MYDTVEDVIAALDQPFPREQLRQRPGGNGMMLDYIEWTKAVRRLDEAVGKNNWSFEPGPFQVVGDGTHGYVICSGTMTVRFPDGTTATKGQMGGNAYGQGLNPDDAAKAAGSDLLKKCAALFGVALDLSEKDGPSGGFGGNRPSGGYGGGSGAPAPQAQSFTGGQDEGDLYCEECGEPLTETRFKDGTNWAPAQLAVFGRRKHSRILCMTHYREANQAKRRAEEALQQVPF